MRIWFCHATRLTPGARRYPGLRKQRKVVAADEVSEMARRARERRAALAAEGGDPSAVALSQLALDGVDLVLKVATKSGSLKGTFTRGLKEAAADIKEAVGVLLNRTASDEVAKLQEENGRLRNDLEDLRRQVAALSEQQQRRTPTDAAPAVAPAPAPRPANAHTDEEVERIVRLCMLQCGSMVNARVEAISRRLPAETTPFPPSFTFYLFPYLNSHHFLPLLPPPPPLLTLTFTPPHHSLFSL
uniref:Uncharacterized protein n=1 Tax=Heliothis virescens TaxID=7102 RepID=A0A2A4K7T6_HELVI